MCSRLHVTLMFLVTIAWAAGPAFAVVSSQNRGTWPEDWPAELDPLREKSRTIMVGTGIQQNIYEIPVSDRETFERVWPAILKVRTPGSPLILTRVSAEPHKDWGDLLKGQSATIRIYGPSGGLSLKEQIDPQNPPDFEKLIREGRALRAEAPWPEEIVGPHGELPEYVVSEEVDGLLTWLPGDPYGEQEIGLFRGFYNRARIDVELVIDGEIIDLNRTRLPDGVVIIDGRFDDNALDAKDQSAEP